MEIDGGGDGEIKRNMPLGVTEAGVRVREMRGLQACESYMGKNNSSRSFSIALPLPPSFFQRASNPLWERRSIFV